MTNAINLAAIGSNGSAAMPNWTTGTRPASPRTGQQGFNTTLNTMEFYNGSAWATGGGFTTQSVQSTGFTAVAGNLYPCNTTSAAFTVTLPASPTVGNQIQIVDYAGTFATNNLTLGRNGSNINGLALTYIMSTNRESIILIYIDSTQGWIVSSAAYTNTPISAIYTASYLVVAGGGGAASGGGGAGGYLTGTASLLSGTVYTAVVGAGSAGVGVSTTTGTGGSNSVLSGGSITTQTAIGGGKGAPIGDTGQGTGGSGGSGGGGGAYGAGTTVGGSGTPGQGFAGGGNGSFTSPPYGSGGGGGAGAVGQTSPAASPAGAGGAGTASSITGTPVTYAGGGGGGSYGSSTGGAGGSGGGGAGNTGSVNGTNGTANTGGGGGGTWSSGTGGNGGSGVVILSVPTANYSGTTTGSPTITTSGSNTIIKWTTTGSGTYTA